MSRIKFHNEGYCPICGSTDIIYGDIYWNTDRIDPMVEQECTCHNCLCEYKEQYNVKHCGKDITWEHPNT